MARFTIVVLFLLQISCSEVATPRCGTLPFLSGGDSADRLDGTDQSECLVGTDGADVLNGGAGNDVLFGGKATDLLAGGPGDDTYVIEVGDGFDFVADEGGSDTIALGPGIDINNIAVREDNGGYAIQIETGEEWAYVLFGGHEASARIERVSFQDGTTYSIEELFELVDRVALPPDDFKRKRMRDATVSAAITDDNDDLFQATAETIRISNSPALCLTPTPYPNPDIRDDRKGFGPAYGFSAGFYGPPADAKADTQRRQYQALAEVGLLRKEPIESPSGEPGVQYRLTWDGWALQSRIGCFHYGFRELREVISYLPTGRTVGDLEAFRVQARVAASDVELWARQLTIAETFPEVVAELEGKSMEVTALKDGDDWVPALRNGQPAANIASAPAWGELPDDRDLLAVEERMFSGTIGTGTVCTALPLLGRGEMNQPGTPYLTYGRYPFQGGHAELNAKSKKYWDMLVEFEAATQHQRFEPDRSGNRISYIEYRVEPAFTVGQGSAGKCLNVASTRFEILHARRANRHEIVVAGRRSAQALYGWVENEVFLAEHPVLARMLGEGAPVVYRITTEPGKPLKFAGATGISRP